MKQLLYILLAAVLISGCVTEKKCNRLFPPQIIKKDSIVTKDTVIYKSVIVTIPGKTIRDSFYLRDTITVIDTVIKDHNTSLSVKLKNGKLTATCKADSLQKVVDYLAAQIKSQHTYSSEVKTVEKIVEKKFIPWWVWLFVLLNVLYLLYKIKTNLFSKIPF